MEDLHFQICLLVFKLMFRSVVETDVVNSPLNNMVLWHFEIEWFGTPESLEANISSICQINSVYVILRSLPIDWCWSILCYKSKSFGRPINDLFMVVCSIDMCHIQWRLSSHSIVTIGHIPISSMIIIIPRICTWSRVMIPWENQLIIICLNFRMLSLNFINFKIWLCLVTVFAENLLVHNKTQNKSKQKYFESAGFL